MTFLDRAGTQMLAVVCWIALHTLFMFVLSFLFEIFTQHGSRRFKESFQSIHLSRGHHTDPCASNFPSRASSASFAPEFGTDQSFDVASWWHVGARQEGRHAHMKNSPSL